MAKRAVKRKVLVVTGTRAEFGLLLPVMRAIQKTRRLSLHVVATGSHLLPPARTAREVKAAFPKTITVPMQRAGKTGRLNDAAATGRGIEGITRVLARVKPDWVVVLGDRVEAFAAASAASIAGIAVCHIHGGDRAEGIADEAMRHAITKLSHLHCAATEQSRGRIVKMGERAEHVFNTGSPAIDGLRLMAPLNDRAAGPLANVGTIVLLHPSGRGDDYERVMAGSIIHAIDESAPGDVLVLAPNHDPGCSVIDSIWRTRAMTPEARVGHADGGPTGNGSTFIVLRKDNPNSINRINGRKWIYRPHLPRATFVGLLRRIAAVGDGLMIGNSSAGLIEASALGLNVVNVGPRQDGRERAGSFVDVSEADTLELMNAISRLRGLALDRSVLGGNTPAHPYGDGRAGPRIAALLAKLDPHDPTLLRKRNAY
ncbi:MAG: UDP-N-acetylglucosamine 2-epimerase [Phycisphaerales bacterium]